MNIEMEDAILQASERLTPEQCEICEKEGERLYDNLNEDDLVQALVSIFKICPHSGEEAVRLELETNDNLRISLESFAQRLAKIIYAMNYSTLYYEVPD